MSMDIKKILMGISVIILIILCVALFQTYSSLQDLEIENTKLEEDVTLLEGEKASLEDIKASLELEVNSLDTEVVSLEEEVDSYQSEIRLLKQDITFLTSRAERLDRQVDSIFGEKLLLQERLDLYKDTYGEIYSGSSPPYITSLSLPFKLVNNEDATNPTYAELLDFLRRDKTDSIPYTSYYTCGEYARDLHDNAEEEGIRAAWVAVHFSGEDDTHALSAFKTTDKGLIFIDVTGGKESGGPALGDRKAVVVLEEEYKSWFLFAVDWIVFPMGVVEWIEVYW